MDKATYISRKVMDKYMAKQDIRIERLHNRIQRLEAGKKIVAEIIANLLEHCEDLQVHVDRHCAQLDEGRDS